MLQTRNAKRPAQAAVRFAVDAVERGPARRASEALRDDRRRRRSTRCCTRPSTRTPSTRCSPRGVAASPGRGQGRDRLHRRRGGRGRARTGRDVILVRPFTEADDVAGFHAAQGILTPRAARPRTRRWSRAAWGGRACAGAGDARDRPRGRATVRVGDTRAARGRPDRDRRHAPARSRPTTCRWSSPRSSERLRDRARAGPTSCAGSACAPTPTRPRTRAGRASSAPRASACAAPSTCSSATTASRRCAR